ncbi:MAG: hypothetical protein S4CHLAM6_02930 [Chlamydiae bacterium]|nr:hypothetical protein [Chlamydiota bacterium]
MRNINLQKQTSPKMLYGFYTPLVGLKEESPFARAKAPKSALSQEPLVGQSQFEKSIKPLNKAGYDGILRKEGKSSFFNAKTAMKLSIVAISALTLGIILSQVAQNADSSLGKNVTDVDHLSGNPSQDSSPSTPMFEVLTQSAQEAVKATATGVSSFSQSAIDSTRQFAFSGYEAGLAVVTGAKSGLIESYYGIPRKLEVVPLSEGDKAILKIRDEYPSYFESGFIPKVLGGNQSATVKAIRLGAALGETSQPIAQLYSQHYRCAGKYSLSLLKDVRSNPNGTPKSKADFISDKEMFGEYKEEGYDKDYETYLESFKEGQAKVDRVINRVDPKIFAKLEAAHMAQTSQESPWVNSLFMRMATKIPDVFTAVGSYFGAAGETRTDFTRRTEYPSSGRLAHNTRVEYSISKLVCKGSRSLAITRDVLSSEARGKAQSAWDKFKMGCSYYQKEAQIQCETFLGGIDHAYGQMRYSLGEKMVTPECSIISESVTSALKNKVHTYALNPKKNLPIIFSHLVNSKRYAKEKVASFWSHMTGKTDAVVAFSTELPEGLPKDCQELSSIENPELGIA